MDDDNEKTLIYLQKDVIARHLKFEDILPCLQRDGFVSAEDLTEITRLAEEKGAEKGASLLLDKLLRCAKKGWESCFIHALRTKHGGNSMILSILQDASKIQQYDMYKTLLEWFIVELVELVKPSDLFIYLKVNDCLSENDITRIQHLQETGSPLAVCALLHTIAKNKNWAGHFFQALKACNSAAYDEIIKNLEPKLDKAGYPIQDQIEKLVLEQQEIKNEDDNQGACSFPPRVGSEAMEIEQRIAYGEQPMSSDLQAKPDLSSGVEGVQQGHMSPQPTIPNGTNLATNKFTSKSGSSAVIEKNENQMSALHSKVLDRSFKYLVNQLEPEDVKDHLYSEGLLTQSEMENLCRSTKTDQMRTLIFTLKKRGPNAYSVFKEAIKECECKNHVLRHLIEMEQEFQGDRNETNLTTLNCKDSAFSSSPAVDTRKSLSPPPYTEHPTLHCDGEPPAKVTFRSTCIDNKQQTTGKDMQESAINDMQELERCESTSCKALSSETQTKEVSYHQPEAADCDADLSMSENIEAKASTTTVFQRSDDDVTYPKLAEEKDQQLEIIKEFEKERGNFPVEELKLRSFQEELAAPCLAGENKLIIAPTNSGKTFVAMRVAKHILDTAKKDPVTGRPTKKVVMFVPKICIAAQQSHQFNTYVPQYKTWFLTGQQSVNSVPIPVALMLEMYDIIVITPQLFYNALKAGDVGFHQLCLMIFDECHHTVSRKPMRLIMTKYHFCRAETEYVQLPQVLGLTASVGLGKHSKIDLKATGKKHIMKLCASLDSTIHLVMKNKEELQEHIGKKQTHAERVQRRKNTSFSKLIFETMEGIQTKVRKAFPSNGPK